MRAHSFAALLFCAAVPAMAQAPATTRPVLIRGAIVVDGSDSPSRITDVRIAGATIRQIGQLTPSADDSVVDARGLVLAPGFIDTHSHHDRGLGRERTALGAVSQGITTIVVGQDGGSNFPLADWFAGFERRPAAVNVASYVGHGRLRAMIMRDDFTRQATPAEVRHMAALLDGEMAAGALGLSSGLEYDPGIYSATDELVALARIAARHGGRYISHIRSEDRHFWAAIDELITIGRRAGLPVQLSHAKLAMRSAWGRADSLIRILDRARGSGVNVTLDIYPYTYWQSTLTVLFPERNFQDTAAARFALTEVTTPDSAILGDFEPDPALAGKSIAEIAGAASHRPRGHSHGSDRRSREAQAGRWELRRECRWITIHPPRLAA